VSGHQAPDPLGPVVIGAREVYDAVMRLTALVDRLSGQHTDAEGDLRDHEARIRALERGRWPLPSLAALCGLAALVVSVLALLGR